MVDIYKSAPFLLISLPDNAVYLSVVSESALILTKMNHSNIFLPLGYNLQKHFISESTTHALDKKYNIYIPRMVSP